MDRSITLITPEMIQELGADAFDRGLSADDHEMNHCASARKDWQFGWHQRRIERSRESGNHAAKQLAPAVARQACA